MSNIGRFDLKKNKSGDYYFNIIAGNGEVIGTSEMYKTKQGAEKGINSVKNNVPNAKVNDTTKKIK